MGSQKKGLSRVSTGVTGLDEIINGGLVPKRGYLIRGGPGTGKTTLGMHFLQEGCKNKEKTLFITLGESEKNLRQNAERINIETEEIAFLDLSPDSEFFADNKSYDLFSPSEVDRDPVTKMIVDRVRSVKPQRVFLDSTSHLRYLAIDANQFRKQLLSFIRFLMEQDSTVIYTSESSLSMPDDDVMYLSDGVFHLTLEQCKRKIEVTKFRGSSFKSGQHTLCITDQGHSVFPVLRPREYRREFVPTQVQSGISEIDEMLGGGIERGTVSVISGPAGAGKTTLGLQFLREAARKGQRTVLYTFEESADMLAYRAQNIGIPITEMIKANLLTVVAVEPLIYSADEVAFLVRQQVEEKHAQIVMLDSVAGYKLSVDNDEVQMSLRALFKYLSNMGVTVIAINETEAITGDFKATEIGISFMVDNVIFLRYLEIRGEMRKVIGILKKRLSDFERNLREFSINAKGIKVGGPLVNLRGILRGVPEWVPGNREKNSEDYQMAEL